MVFRLSKTGKETTLFRFGPDSGLYPNGDLVADQNGNLYGTTQGGSASCGVVFKVDKKGGGGSVLYAFQCSPDGAVPGAGLTIDDAGNLYGTTYYGGIGHCFVLGEACGTVFKIDAGGKETQLYAFSDDGLGGFFPLARPSRTKDGSLYGTTERGGQLSCAKGKGCGVVFKLDSNGVETVLHKFAGFGDGRVPQSGLIRGPDGNMYGVTPYGGDSRMGSIFKIDQAGNETVLYSFFGAGMGESPFGNLAFDADGNIYGTTSYTYSDVRGYGIIFKLDKSGKLTVLYTFTGGVDGGYPNGLIRDQSGNLYGTTRRGGHGRSCCGTVFMFTP